MFNRCVAVIVYFIVFFVCVQIWPYIVFPKYIASKKERVNLALRHSNHRSAALVGGGRRGDLQCMLFTFP